MINIVLQDEELVALVEAEARAQHMTVEKLMETLVRKELTKPKPQSKSQQDDDDERMRQTMHKIYNIARRYWVSVGDTERANLSDEYLDEHFGAFDEDGIPRFKDELPEEPPVGSLAYAIKVIEETGGVIIDEPLKEPFDLTNLKEAMAKEYGDYLYKRMNGEYDE